jgi:replication initiation and membrane attachment protein
MLRTDSYNVINKNFITELDRKTVIDLYQPIIGTVAVSLYFNLINDIEKKEIISSDLSFNDLIKRTKLSLTDITMALEKLEAVGLVETYRNGNSYIFNIFNALLPNEFLNNPLLNMALYNNLGKEMYDKVVMPYKLPKISLKDYENISHRFDEVFKSSPTSTYIVNEDIKSKITNKLKFTDYDFDLLVSGTMGIDLKKWLTDSNKELINSLSVLYDIDVLNMQNIIMSSIGDKGVIDKELLRKNCRNYYQFEQDGSLPTIIYKSQPKYLKNSSNEESKRDKMIYVFENVNPYYFLKSKYKDGKVTTRDLKLLEDLLVDQKLNPGVINVLIDYVLKINDQKLNKSYIEAIAGHWKRLGITTVKEAMSICEKEHSKIKNKVEKKSDKIKDVKEPGWFNQEFDKKEMTKEEVKELKEMLENMN